MAAVYNKLGVRSGKEHSFSESLPSFLGPLSGDDFFQLAGDHTLVLGTGDEGIPGLRLLCNVSVGIRGTFFHQLVASPSG